MQPVEQRLLPILERMFALPPMPVELALSRCADAIAEVLPSDKVDAFLHDAATNTLVAMGTTSSEMSQLQVGTGLHRLPVANGDPVARVFETGELYREGHVERDERQPRGVIDVLGVRSMLAVPLAVGGVRRGVLSVASGRAEAYGADDLQLLKVVAVWVGGLVHRSELLEAASQRATEDGRRTAAEELVTVLAHDLRNLLSPIANRAAVLLTRARNQGRPDDVHECERLLSSVARLSDLVSHLLDVARIEQGLWSLELDSLDLVALVRGVAERLALTDVDVRVDAYPPELRLEADRERLTQAFENVVSNATKHSPRGVPVTIRVRRSSQNAREVALVTVVDQGTGIPADLLPRVFDRYVAEGQRSGLGLGLYLVRAVIAAHGGRITMSSKPAEGTRCEIVLPLAAEPAAPDPPK